MRSRTETLLRHTLEEIRRIEARIKKRADIGLMDSEYLVKGETAIRDASGTKERSLELTAKEYQQILALIEDHLEELGYEVVNTKTKLAIKKKA